MVYYLTRIRQIRLKHGTAVYLVTSKYKDYVLEAKDRTFLSALAVAQQHIQAFHFKRAVDSGRLKMEWTLE